MGKNIVILNGSPRMNGNTSVLIDAFVSGAEKSGNTVTRFDLHRMKIHSCLGCYGGGQDQLSPCVQKDDMDQIYPAYLNSDVVVLASPMYYWSFSAQLKTAFDRLFAVAESNPDYANPRKECILLMAAEGNDCENSAPVFSYYQALLHRLRWTNKGIILAGGVAQVGDIKGKAVLKEAEELGRSLN